MGLFVAFSLILPCKIAQAAGGWLSMTLVYSVHGALDPTN